MTAATQPVTLPPWSRKTVYVLSGLVGFCALAASGFELYSLARNAGFAIGVALALPVGLDAGAAGAAVLWVVGPHRSALRRQGKVTTLVLVTVSAVCNGVSVLAVPIRTVVGQQAAAEVTVGFVTFVAFVLAFVFPLVAARAIHLLLSVRDVAGNTADQPRVPTVPVRVAMPAPPRHAAVEQPAIDDAIPPDMAALEPPVDTGPPTDPFPPQLDDEGDQEALDRLVAMRQEHGPRGRHKERAALSCGWPRYDRIVTALDQEGTRA